jgi:hypothetical protein
MKSSSRRSSSRRKLYKMHRTGAIESMDRRVETVTMEMIMTMMKIRRTITMKKVSQRVMKIPRKRFRHRERRTKSSLLK